jgi:hypothetical protein
MITPRDIPVGQFTFGLFRRLGTPWPSIHVKTVTVCAENIGKAEDLAREEIQNGVTDQDKICANALRLGTAYVKHLKTEPNPEYVA